MEWNSHEIKGIIENIIPFVTLFSLHWLIQREPILLKLLIWMSSLNQRQKFSYFIVAS